MALKCLMFGFLILCLLQSAELKNDSSKRSSEEDAHSNENGSDDVTDDSTPEDFEEVTDPPVVLDKSFTYVTRDVGVLPYQCGFVYGGGSNRLLYVGRKVFGDGSIVPISIHHYGRKGSEFYTAVVGDKVYQGNGTVEWLCSDYGVGWVRVQNFTPDVLSALNAVPIGYNATTEQPIYSCLSHSFYNDKYPAAVGQVVDGECQFDVKNEVVSTKDFTWWHSMELLVGLDVTK